MMLTGYLNSFHLPVRYHVAINQRIPKLLEEVITPSLLFSLHSLVGLQAMMLKTTLLAICIITKLVHVDSDTWQYDTCTDKPILKRFCLQLKIYITRSCGIGSQFPNVF